MFRLVAFSFYRTELTDTAKCDALSPGQSVNFELEVQATSCAGVSGTRSETFSVYPLGLSESLTITAEVDCACVCDDTVRSQQKVLCWYHLVWPCHYKQKHYISLLYKAPLGRLLFVLKINVLSIHYT